MIVRLSGLYFTPTVNKKSPAGTFFVSVGFGFYAASVSLAQEGESSLILNSFAGVLSDPLRFVLHYLLQGGLDFSDDTQA